ncbi:hypothetical protein SBA1_110007 [Candidatus Sulfotelmatobacter kueseliae]|uniref:Uncharacterized protein n=1 Tax=Candidatus Sulfotelmatobacter kueseliae TaxID=2042962 RepID=A0A2U3JZU7_9BACT|nr:hypothetical protein SBA1_110007 [Candidatus Sulfotelmatobacter kueseliae]
MFVTQRGAAARGAFFASFVVLYFLPCRLRARLGIVVGSDATVRYLPYQFRGRAVSRFLKEKIHECSVVGRFGADW